ncbi:hypothetical protein [Coralliovum pocilloporae]|uniref:hypothetical protein n=1 Tax=Coralliovum pocilloporae TaxID=3066369 RepID=UPI003306EF61
MTALRLPLTLPSVIPLARLLLSEFRYAVSERRNLPGIAREKGEMRMMKRVSTGCVISLFWGLFWLWPAAAQTIDSPERWADGFMKTLSEKGVDPAHDIIRMTMSGQGDGHSQGLASLEQAMKTAEANYGSSLGYEFISKRAVSDSVRLIFMINKRGKAPIFWKFAFYNPDENWTLLNINLSDQLADLDDFKRFTWP